MFRRICHTAVTVKNLNETLDFYTMLGFEEVCKYKDNQVEIRRLSLSDTELELFSYLNADNHQQTDISLPEKLKQPGWQHIAIGTDNINTALTWAKEKKLVEPSRTVTQGRTGINYFFIHDPEGNFVEIMESN